MKQETAKKKLVFRKTLVANMNNDAANQILGGGGTTYSDTPCACRTRGPECDMGSTSMTYSTAFCNCDCAIQ